MSAIPVIFGRALRATLTDACGKPIQGAASTIVTKAFISVTLSPDITAAEEKTQKNAEGKDCFKKRTPPEFNRHNVDLKVCGADPALYALLTGYEQILDHDDTPIGFADGAEVSRKRGVVIEVWTDAMTDESCPMPITDAMFSQEGTGEMFGLLLFGATEWIESGDFVVSENPSELGFNAITMPIPRWHRGPYNVARIDANNTAGRLLVPVGNTRHRSFFKTPIAPPEETNGLVPLAVQSIFTAPNYYASGPNGEPAVDIAPAQPVVAATKTVTVSITGTAPTSGDFQVLLNGNPAVITYNSTAAAAKSAVVAVDDGITAAQIVAAGGALPATPIVFTIPADATMSLGTSTLNNGAVAHVVTS